MSWEDMYEKLQGYRRRHEHVNVTWADDKELHTWLNAQKIKNHNRQLDVFSFHKLNSLGVDWELRAKDPPQAPGSSLALSAPTVLPEVKSKSRDQNDDWDCDWDLTYLEFRDFKEKERHIQVPKHGVHQKLAQWLDAQRSLHHSGRLSLDRQSLMKRVDANWLAVKKGNSESAWDDYFDQLVAFEERFGHTLVQPNIEQIDLYKWTNSQRTLYMRNELGKEKVGKLNRLGFRWSFDTGIEQSSDVNRENHEESSRDNGKTDDINGDTDEPRRLMKVWKTHFEELKAFKSRYGHTLVSKTDKLSLYRWVHGQRILYEMNLLGEEKTRKLNSIGFSWNAENAVVPLVKANNRLNDPNTPEHCQKERILEVEDNDHNKLSINKRNQNDENTTEADDLDIEDIVDTDDYLTKEWVARFWELTAFKNRHGHTKVSREKQEMLWYWVYHQRSMYKKNMLHEEKIRKLNRINFSWSDDQHNDIDKGNQVQHLNNVSKLDGAGELLDRQERFIKVWNNHFEQLVAFKNRFGHTSVTSTEQKSLYQWVYRQKTLYKKKMLDEEKFRRLDSIGLIWHMNINRKANRRRDQSNEGVNDRYEGIWNAHFRELVSLKKLYGRTFMPTTEQKGLYHWAYQQKRKYKEKTLDKKKIDKLNSIAFCWSIGKRFDRKLSSDDNSDGYDSEVEQVAGENVVMSDSQSGSTTNFDIPERLHHVKSDSVDSNVIHLTNKRPVSLSPVNTIPTYVTIHAVELQEIMKGLANGSLPAGEAATRLSSISQLRWEGS